MQNYIVKKSKCEVSWDEVEVWIAEKSFREAATGHVHCRTLVAVAERFREVGCSLITSLALTHMIAIDRNRGGNKKKYNRPRISCCLSSYLAPTPPQLYSYQHLPYLSLCLSFFFMAGTACFCKLTEGGGGSQVDRRQKSTDIFQYMYSFSDTSCTLQWLQWWFCLNDRNERLGFTQPLKKGTI